MNNNGLSYSERGYATDAGDAQVCESVQESTGVLGRIAAINRTIDNVNENLHIVKENLGPILSEFESEPTCGDTEKLQNGNSPMYYALDQINCRCSDIAEAIRKINQCLNI